MGNRNILSQQIGNVGFKVALFDGTDSSEKGMCAIYSEVWIGRSSAEVRSYGYAADLRRLGEAFLAAAAEAGDRADTVANARLNDAAPELLEAGKALLDLLENWHPMEGWPASTEQAGKLRKAITKATGG